MKILTTFLLSNIFNTTIIINAETTTAKKKLRTTIPAMYPESEAVATGVVDFDTVSFKPKE